MQDVSVLPFWRCLERRGGPDVYVTEYFRVHRDSIPEKEILRSITDFPGKKPVIAQMIGNEPPELVRTARAIQSASDCAGIDVNLGCPAPQICGKNAGGALLKNHDLIRRIANELRPVVTGTLTLKTRIGFESPTEFDGLLELFADLPIDGLAIHARTVRERYQTPVHPECIARAVKELTYPVAANGNVVSVDTALAFLDHSSAAGLMIGRGGIRNPWLFEQVRNTLNGESVFEPTLKDVHQYVLELADEIATAGNFANGTGLVHRMKKFTNYIASGIHDGELNYHLRRSTSWKDFQQLCREHLDNDEPFPDEPHDDGKLFCGFRELVKR